MARIGATAAALLSAAALGGCAIAVQQPQEAAAQLYHSYLRVAIEYPQFVYEKQDILKMPEREGMKYTLFAGMALDTAQRIYLLTGERSPQWVATVKSIIANHHTYIVLNFAACADLDREFVQFLKKEVKGYECK
jgi:hypothetical protein